MTCCTADSKWVDSDMMISHNDNLNVLHLSRLVNRF